MELRGKIVSISRNTVDVGIIQESKTCENCSACPKKMGVQDIVRVAAIKGISVGQEVIVRGNKNWFIKNRIMLIVIAFVSGMIITETISRTTSIRIHSKNIHILVGSIFTLVVSFLLWIKKPRYLFKIDLVKGEKV